MRKYEVLARLLILKSIDSRVGQLPLSWVQAASHSDLKYHLPIEAENALPLLDTPAFTEFKDVAKPMLEFWSQQPRAAPGAAADGAAAAAGDDDAAARILLALQGQAAPQRNLRPPRRAAAAANAHAPH